ncbi:DUF4956 domain-containing protein [Candidatus Pelagibacter sp.]|nr:DUF4956 domain-containing protein [Candidatus Pelagibacter sp.]
METIFLSTITNKLLIVFLLIIISISIRFAISLSGENWVKTFSQTFTIISLPIITYGITSVISNNIALSLGLVGALSIVRFRHPVRSAMELTVYFLLISLGITASANYKWTILLGLSSIFLIVILSLIKKYKNHAFPISFQEGNENNTLEIIADMEIKNIENNKNLIYFQKSNEKYLYRFSSDNKDLLINIIKDLENSNVRFEHTLHLS